MKAFYVARQVILGIVLLGIAIHVVLTSLHDLIDSMQHHGILLGGLIWSALFAFSAWVVWEVRR